MNIIVWLEYELTYHDSAVHHFNNYTMRTPHHNLYGEGVKLQRDFIWKELEFTRAHKRNKLLIKFFSFKTKHLKYIYLYTHTHTHTLFLYTKIHSNAPLCNISSLQRIQLTYSRPHWQGDWTNGYFGLTNGYFTGPLAYRVECLLMARETWVQSRVESYQRLKKWYLISPCLTLSIIR